MIFGTKPDDVITPPTVTGPYGKAWHVDLPAAVKLAGVESENDANILSVMVEAPWAHPFWHSYWFNLVHLRPLPDNRDTIIYLPGATHEFWLGALSPEYSRDDMLRTGKMRNMSPMNFAAQIIEPDDASAINRVNAAIAEVLNGTLSPDTDFIREWMKRFGDNMVKKG